MVEFSVVVADILKHSCDLLILKHADGFHGVDALVAEQIGFKRALKIGGHAFVRGRRVKAQEVLFLGVGPLSDFRYERIRAFAAQALALALADDDGTEVVGTPLHGPGYGLDEKESFLSMIAGFTDALERGEAPPALSRIDIVEINAHRAERLAKWLEPILPGSVPAEGRGPAAPQGGRAVVPARTIKRQLKSFGAASERKPNLFVAMPYASKYDDVWDVAIQDSCAKVGILSERMSEQSFVGDIVSEMKKRIDQANGMIALLDGANANVFLEIGYAWAIEKPTILLAGIRTKLPFDVRGQRCLKYKSIGDLRTQLIRELQELADQGIFSPN